MATLIRISTDGVRVSTGGRGSDQGAGSAELVDGAGYLTSTLGVMFGGGTPDNFARCCPHGESQPFRMNQEDWAARDYGSGIIGR